MSLPISILQYIFDFSNDLWILSFENNRWRFIINKKNTFIRKIENHYENRFNNACRTYNYVDRTEEYYFKIKSINDPTITYIYNYYSVSQYTVTYSLDEPDDCEVVYHDPYYFVSFKTELTFNKYYK